MRLFVTLLMIVTGSLIADETPQPLPDPIGQDPPTIILPTVPVLEEPEQEIFQPPKPKKAVAGIIA